KEVEAVVVVEHDRDVRPRLRQPLLRDGKSVEERLPIGVLLQALGDRIADRGNMRGADTADDPCHDYLPAAWSFALKAATDIPVCCAPMSWTLRPKIPASLAR